jgi:hypothetical protein
VLKAAHKIISLTRGNPSRVAGYVPGCVGLIDFGYWVANTSTPRVDTHLSLACEFMKQYIPTPATREFVKIVQSTFFWAEMEPISRLCTCTVDSLITHTHRERLWGIREYGLSERSDKITSPLKGASSYTRQAMCLNSKITEPWESVQQQLIIPLKVATSV